MLEEVRVYEGLSGVKSVAWNVQEIKRVSRIREKINRVSWIIFIQITVLFVALNNYLMYLVKRAPWNREFFNRVPCLLHPHWDPRLFLVTMIWHRQIGMEIYHWM